MKIKPNATSDITFPFKQHGNFVTMKDSECSSL